MTPHALVLGAWLALAVAPPQPEATRPSPFVERGVAVPMRDGVVLRADVLRPAKNGRFPTLILRTPYDRGDDEEDEVVRAALARGYAVVLQDVRGRYGSGGEFVPYAREGPDGYDTIEWTAGQPWSTGDVGTFGLSYPAAVQWLAAVEAPPHLKAMVPAMTFSSPRNFFYAGGAWDLSWIAWIWDNIAPDARVKKGLPGPRTGREARAAWKAKEGAILPFRLPLTDLPELRAEAPFYFDWLAHPPRDAFWDWAELRGRYGKVRAAVLNISGWHDEAYGPEGAMTNFLGLLAARQGEKDPRNRIILGPWVHGGVSADHAGQRVFGPQARLDYPEEILRFMDRYVRGIDNGVEAEPRVRTFVMGENAWRTAETLPLPGTRPLSLFLSPAGRLAREAPPAGEPSSTAFESDPAHPVLNAYAGQPGAHDYRGLAGEAGRRGLRDRASHRPAARRRGPSRPRSSSRPTPPDADLWVKLEDVAPDGTAWNLSSPGTDVLRVSSRDPGGAPEAAPAGRDRGDPASRTFGPATSSPRATACGSFCAEASCRTSRATCRPENPRRARGRRERRRSGSTTTRRTRRGSCCRWSPTRGLGEGAAERRAPPVSSGARRALRNARGADPDPDARRCAAGGHVVPARLRRHRRTVPGDPGVPAVPQRRRDASGRPEQVPVRRLARLRRRPRRHPRHRPQRGPASRPRILGAGAARCPGGDRVAGPAAVVQRQRRDVGDLLGRLQLPPDRGAPPSGLEGDRAARWPRRISSRTTSTTSTVSSTSTCSSWRWRSSWPSRARPTTRSTRPAWPSASTTRRGRCSTASSSATGRSGAARR